MKYPITPDYIASLPEPLCRLYEGLEAFILSDICSRFKNAETATESAIEQIRVLQRRGYSVEAINKYIKETLKLSDAEFNRMWADAVGRNQEYFDYIIDDTDIIGNGFDQLAFDAEINAIERQTMGALSNITRTMGFAIRSWDGKVQMLDFEESYIKVLDDAMLRVETGGCSYSEAIREATKKLTDSGVQYIDYKSGWHNRLDVAVRRAVMTGVTQLSAQYSEQEAEILDTPYREVSAHRGARDGEGRNPWSSHKAWQGKVYSVRDNDIYPSIYAVCGWGEVDGLEGINCRHMHFPFVEGVSERTYTDEELEKIDPPPFEFEGRKYTAYEATQKQRQVEASLRKIKREMIAAKSTGDDDRYTQFSIRYNRLNEEYTKFSKAAGLKPQRERSYISEFTPKDAREAYTEAQSGEMSRKAKDMGYPPPTNNSPEALAELEKYALERNVRIYNCKAYDGDIEFMREQVDAVYEIKRAFNLNPKQKVVLSQYGDKPDVYAKTYGQRKIVYYRLVTRNKAHTDRELRNDAGIAINESKGIAAHEMGHILCNIKGNKGVAIARQAYYNLNGKWLNDIELRKMLKRDVSNYCAEPVLQIGENVEDLPANVILSKCGEIISEILAKYWCNPNAFVTEAYRLMQEVYK